ncbi:hypothetical protein ACFLRM_02180 [Acidobacteriota bacterium]
MLRAPFLSWIPLALLIMACCRPSAVLISSFPSKIDRMEGYASLRISGEQGVTRARFSFLFHLPDQGRIEVSDFLGRTLYQVIINGDKAFFVLPSKEAYWQGEEEEIINKFLGFTMALHEMTSLLSGQWKRPMDYNKGNKNSEAWLLERDEKGRILAGQRGSLRFERKEFIENSPIARILVFEHAKIIGRVKVLSIEFNRALKNNVFSTLFVRNYKQKTWAEFQALMNNES